MITHSELVKALVKSPDAIVEGLHRMNSAGRLHMAIGIAGEAGELLDAIKKESLYEKALDMMNVIEELGDLEFYMEGLRQELCITREDCLQHNILKLTKRYGEKYSNEAAQAREDKA